MDLSAVGDRERAQVGEPGGDRAPGSRGTASVMPQARTIQSSSRASPCSARAQGVGGEGEGLRRMAQYGGARCGVYPIPATLSTHSSWAGSSQSP